MTDRRWARELASTATDPVGWFETLYREAGSGTAEVPWDDGVPNPHLVEWLDHQQPPPGTRVLEAGCRYGDSTVELVRRQLDVTAFDVSPTAVAEARGRLRVTGVALRVEDLLDLPSDFDRAFELVVEVYTLQVLPPEARMEALAALAGTVAPGGKLLVVARGRDAVDPVGEFPWPLTQSDLAALADAGLEELTFDDFLDDEDPPVRRFRTVWQRPLARGI